MEKEFNLKVLTSTDMTEEELLKEIVDIEEHLNTVFPFLRFHIFETNKRDDSENNYYDNLNDRR